MRGEDRGVAEAQLISIRLDHADDIELYLLNESRSPSGSLKHRLARSLFIHALCSGWIGPCTVVVDASSGSTAVSEAYFARLLGLRFIAVLPASTSPEKIAAIEAQGGQWHMVDDPRAIYAEAVRIAAERGGHYLDQFTYAESVTDWRRDNIAEAIVEGLRDERARPCRWIVCGAGTGGTSATIGRYLRFEQHQTSLCLADPQGSVYHRHHADRAVRTLDGPSSYIEGVGRPRVEPSFIPDVIDRVIVVPDATSIAAAHHLSKVLGERCGPSTGMNLHASLVLVDEMVRTGETGSIVTLLCDSGDRYASTCFDDGWLAERGLLTGGRTDLLERHLPLPAIGRARRRPPQSSWTPCEEAATVNDMA